MSEQTENSMVLTESTKYELQVSNESSTTLTAPEVKDIKDGVNGENGNNRATPTVKVIPEHKMPALTPNERVREWLKRNFEQVGDAAVLTPIKRQTLRVPPKP